MICVFIFCLCAYCHCFISFMLLIFLFSVFFCLLVFLPSLRSVIHRLTWLAHHSYFYSLPNYFVFWPFNPCWVDCNRRSAGFIKSPLSQMKLLDNDAELHCEVIGNPIPEVQWWFIEGEEPNETLTQLFDGARGGRVEINATYIAHATSTIYLASLTYDDSGTYECRASNDPDRNELKKTPKIKWIRSQANIIVIESEWQGEAWGDIALAVISSLVMSRALSSRYTQPPCFLDQFPLSVHPSCFPQSDSVSLSLSPRAPSVVL